MKITPEEAHLLVLAAETRIRVLNQFMTHPVLSTCIEKEERERMCATQERYVKLIRKLESSRKATLRLSLIPGRGAECL